MSHGFNCGDPIHNSVVFVFVLVCCVAEFANSADGVHLMTLTYLFTCVKYI